VLKHFPSIVLTASGIYQWTGLELKLKNNGKLPLIAGNNNSSIGGELKAY